MGSVSETNALTLLDPSASMRFLKNSAVLTAECRSSPHTPVSTYTGSGVKMTRLQMLVMDRSVHRSPPTITSPDASARSTRASTTFFMSS